MASGRRDTLNAPTLSAAEGKSASYQRRAVLDLLADPVFCVAAADQKIVEVNLAACAALGYARQELLGLPLAKICRAEDLTNLAREFAAAPVAQPPPRGSQTTVLLRVEQRRKDGGVVPSEWHVARIAEGPGESWVIVARGLAAAVRREAAADAVAGASAAAANLDLPGYDPLTGLADRRLFEHRLDRALGRAGRDGVGQCAVMFLDLDGFKAVNDAFGHLRGDGVLVEIAGRLAASLRPGDLVARFGGDEFTVLLEGLRDARDALTVAERLLAAIRAPVVIEGRTMQIGASIGIVAADGGCLSAAELLRRADQAMYQAKAQGGRAALFSEEGV